MFSISDIREVTTSYNDVVELSKINIIKSFHASGSMVNNIDHIFYEFKKIFLTEFKPQEPEAAYLLSIPFHIYYFEVLINLSFLKNNIYNFYNYFLRKSINNCEEILILKEDIKSGIGLFVEEHKYYISYW